MLIIFSQCFVGCRSIFDEPAKVEKEIHGYWKLYEVKDSTGNMISIDELNYTQIFQRKIISRVHHSKGDWVDSVKIFRNKNLYYSEAINHISESDLENNFLVYGLKDEKYISMKLFYSDNAKRLEITGPADRLFYINKNRGVFYYTHISEGEAMEYLHK